MTIFHLWLDFETTGLNPETDTILEAAWTLTDENLAMLTPLRSRLCCIDPPGNIQIGLTFAIGDRRIGEEGGWNRLSSVVQEMHEQSGLRDALEHAVDDSVGAMLALSQPRDLERLLREDLAAVGYDRYEDRLILSGAGVSHFDDRVLNVHLPEMFPIEGNGSGGYAYWRHDVSIAQRALGPAWDALRSAAWKEPSDSSLFRCERLSPVSPICPVQTGLDGEFLLGELTAHRAADDVAAALVDGRILRDAERLFAAESQRSS